MTTLNASPENRRQLLPGPIPRLRDGTGRYKFKGNIHCEEPAGRRRYDGNGGMVSGQAAL